MARRPPSPNLQGEREREKDRESERERESFPQTPEAGEDYSKGQSKAPLPARGWGLLR